MIDRCWFGKRVGVYMDYIYQGPMILVLLVRTASVILNTVFRVTIKGKAEIE